MAAGNDASSASAASHHLAMANAASCDQSADYAVICSFFEQFGDKSGLLFPSFQDLKVMLENTDEVAYPLAELHVKLMRKLKKTVNFDRWEKSAAKFAHSYSQQDGWEIERFGYKKMGIDVKLRLLKNLLEAQFDGNVKFKSEINKVDSNELRLMPLGRDRRGRRYWHQMDDECNIRVFREDQDEETWELVCDDKESMIKLIEQLTAAKDSSSSEEEQSPPTSNEDSNANSQDSNGATTDAAPPEPKKSKTEAEESEPTKPEPTNHEPSVPEPAASECEATKPTKPEPAVATEPEVSEAIESPVLLVQGEGNGADCDTGNPGDPSQEDCQEMNKTDTSDLSKNPASEPAGKTLDESQTCPEDTPSPSQNSSGDQLGIVEASVSESGSSATQDASNTSSETVQPVDSVEPVMAEEQTAVSPLPVAKSTELVSISEPETRAEQPAVQEGEVRKIAEARAEAEEPQPAEDEAPETCAERPAVQEVEVRKIAEARAEAEEPQPPEDEAPEDHPVIPTASEPVPGPPDPSIDGTLPVDSGKPETAPEAEAETRETLNSPKPVEECVSKTAPAEVEIGASLGTECLEDASAPEAKLETPAGVLEVLDEGGSVLATSAESADRAMESNDSDRPEAVPEAEESSELKKNPAERTNPPENSEMEADAPATAAVDAPEVEAMDVDVAELEESKPEVMETTESPQAEEIEGPAVVPVPVVSETTPAVPGLEEESDQCRAVHPEVNSTLPVPEAPGTPEKAEYSVPVPLALPVEVDVEVAKPASLPPPTESQPALAESGIEAVEASEPTEAQGAEPASLPAATESQPAHADSRIGLVEASEPSKASAEATESEPVNPGAEISIAEAAISEVPMKESPKTEGSPPVGDSEDNPPPPVVAHVPVTSESEKAPEAPEATETVPAEVVPHEHEPTPQVEVKTEPHPTYSGTAVFAVKSRPLEVPTIEAESTDALCNGGGIKSEPSVDAPKSEEAKESAAAGEESAKSSILQLAFDFDGTTAALPVIPRAFLPEVKTTGAVDEAAGKRRGRKKGKAGGDAPKSPPVLRQSSRIAKLREKEDEERRKLEAERLQRLKEEHERREKRRLEREERMKKLTEKQQRRQEKREKVVYKSDDGEDSEEEEEDDDSGTSDGGIKDRKAKDKKRKRRKHGQGLKKGQRPWDSSGSSEESSSSDDDCLADLQALDEENEELVFKSDHEFSPESDLDGDDEQAAQPTKHARTARAGQGKSKKAAKVLVEEEAAAEEAEEEEEEVEEEEDHNCQKCGQSDHPEWILLCDRCDYGWHASCVRPALMVIPEGDWFCPPCEHALLLERLQERLEEYEFLRKEKEETERRKEQERLTKEAEEAARAEAEMAEEEDEEEEEDDANSGIDDQLDGMGEEETSEEEEGDKESEESEDESDQPEDSDDDNIHRRRQRKAAQQANYSFKEFDDMIKSALEDEGEEGKVNPANPEGENGAEVPPPPVRPMGGKRMSTSDDDSDIVPSRGARKKKARKLNDLSATEDEDDSDEDFEGASSSASDSEDDDEVPSESGSSFVVDDDSDSDVVDVRPARKRAPSPTVTRRSTRNSKRRNFKMLDTSDSEEEESEESDYDSRSRKRKRGNESWDESGDSSSDASWGRSKKKKRGGAKPAPVRAPPKPKVKRSPPARKPAARGRGRGAGGRGKGDSDDEPFRTNVSVKKIKESSRAAAAKDDDDSDHQQRRSTRGRQVSYKELISSGESQDESSNAKNIRGGLASARGASFAGAGRGVGRGRGRAPSAEPPRMRPQPAHPTLEDDSRFSGSAGENTLDFANAAAAAAAAAATVYTSAGDDSHLSNEVLPPPIIDTDLAALPTLLPHDQGAADAPIVGPPVGAVKDDPPPSAISASSVLPPDLQVTRLIQQHPQQPTQPSMLPADLQINRLINSQPAGGMVQHMASPARNSPIMTLTPPPIGPPSLTPEYGGVIKQARHSLPPTPPLYSGPLSSGSVVKNISEPVATSVIRPFPTSAASMSSNPLSIQGLLGSSTPPHVPNPHTAPPHAAPPTRPFAPSSHLIGHGPFLNHPSVPPYSSYDPTISSGGSGVQSVRPPPYMGTPVTPTPRPAYPPMYSAPHVPHVVPHGLPPLHPSPYPSHPGAGPLRPTSTYQHAGFPQAFAAAAAAAASAEEERRIYRLAQGSPLLAKTGVEDLPPHQPPPPPPPAQGPGAAESEFGGLVSYFSSQQEDFEES